MTNCVTKKSAYFKQCSIDFNPGNPSNPTNPCSQQVNSQLITRGAGGRGEALRSAPTPKGYRACQEGFSPTVDFCLILRFWRFREVRPCRRPLPKLNQKVIKNRIRKKFRILSQNGLPKGPSKSQKSDQICKMGLPNALRELVCPLSFQKWFPSRLQRPPEP